MEGEKFLTMKEVGDLIRVDRSTVYNWKRRGLLPHYKIGKRAVRFKLAEVLRWLETQKKEASREGQELKRKKQYAGRRSPV